jgi:hypothetical protein
MDLNARRRTGAAKLLTITFPAVALTTVLSIAATEAWVRATHEPRNGAPGLFTPDPVRRIRLAPNYSGWFAGVPVHINSLGLRDEREYPIVKRPNTFRILVLGDSVTFGHGSVAAHTYPRLLEDDLRAWRPDVDWQVWNAAVPGYNTSQELAQLLDLGPVAKPDLVVVGFYENDVTDNFDVAAPGRATVIASRIRALTQEHFYSFDLYRKVWLTLQWKLSASDAYRRRLEALDSEEQMYRRPLQVADSDLQRLTPYERIPDDAVLRDCLTGQRPHPGIAEAIRNDRDWPRWVRAVRRFQDLNRRGVYRVVFFMNVIPVVCPDGDLFYDGGVGIENDLFMSVVSEGTPAVSTFEAFLHRRPSQMPYAQAHAIGNSNATKAETLFAYLRDQHLVPQR